MTLRANRHTHTHTIAHKYILRRNMLWLGQQLTATHTHTHIRTKAKANNIIYGLSTKRETIKAAKKASKKSEIQPEWTQLNRQEDHRGQQDEAEETRKQTN